MTKDEYIEHVARRMLVSDYRNIEILSTKESHHGADITATDPYGRKVCVACRKNKRNMVGKRDVQIVLNGMEYYRCSFGVIASHTDYTEEAKAYAKETGIILWKL